MRWVGETPREKNRQAPEHPFRYRRFRRHLLPLRPGFHTTPTRTTACAPRCGRARSPAQRSGSLWRLGGITEYRVQLAPLPERPCGVV